MKVYRIKKKPIIVEAVLLEANPESITNALEFMNVQEVSNLRQILNQGHLKLKTPESGGETQNADFGDYILKGYTEKLGTHFWPVKPDYIEQNYEFVV